MIIVLKKCFFNGIAFSLSFFSLYAVGGVIFGFKRIYNANMAIIKITHNKSIIDSKGDFFPRFVTTLRGYLEVYPNADLLFYVFLFSISILGVLILIKKIKYTDVGIIPFIFLISIVFYVAASVLFFFANSPVRIFIPLIPFVFIFIYTSVSIVSNTIFSKKYGLSVTAVLTIFLISICFFSFPMKAFVSDVRPSIYRWVYNVLKEEVSHKNRLLVTPYTITPTEGFSSICYFGEDSISIYKCDRPFNDFIKRNSIRYIYFAKRRTTPNYNGCVYCYPMETKDYSIKREYSYILSYLKENKSKGLIAESMHGYIFDISSELN
ncbi:MAG: hypothetical protein K8S18_10785 [Desulfobacula sp.]|nr:hypothetical protein [Desulfobacula sp.]